MNYKKGFVSVVIPCLNEEEGISYCLGKIKRIFKEHKIKGEIIVVDNGCQDRTVEIAKKFGVKIVYEPNKGYGNAYLSGFKEVKGEYVIMGDGDNSYDFNDIPRLLNKLEDCDFVIGKRRYIKKNAAPFLHRYLGWPIFSLLTRYLFKIEINDFHCGFGVVKKEALDKLKLKSGGMEFASEILIQAKKQGLKIKGIPITYYPRFGTPKLRTFRDGFRHLILIFKEYFNLY